MLFVDSAGLISPTKFSSVNLNVWTVTHKGKGGGWLLGEGCVSHVTKVYYCIKYFDDLE